MGIWILVSRIDDRQSASDNFLMTIHSSHSHDADTEALLERIAGKTLDPEVHRWVQERGTKVTSESRDP